MYSGKLKVVFGQKLMYYCKSGGIRAKVVVYAGKIRCILFKYGCVFGQKWLYSGKVICILAKVDVFVQSGCILTKVVVFGQSGCIRAKVVVFW